MSTPGTCTAVNNCGSSFSTSQSSNSEPRSRFAGPGNCNNCPGGKAARRQTQSSQLLRQRVTRFSAIPQPGCSYNTGGSGNGTSCTSTVRIPLPGNGCNTVFVIESNNGQVTTPGGAGPCLQLNCSDAGGECIPPSQRSKKNACGQCPPATHTCLNPCTFRTEQCNGVGASQKNATEGATDCGPCVSAILQCAQEYACVTNRVPDVNWAVGVANAFGFGVRTNSCDQIAAVGQTVAAVTFSPTVTLPAPPAGTRAGFVVKYSDKGVPICAAQNISQDGDVLNTSVDFDRENNMFISGFFNGSSVEFVNNPPNTSILLNNPSTATSMYVAKLTPQCVWSWAIVGSSSNNGNAEALDIAVDRFRDSQIVHVIGIYENQFTFGTESVTSPTDGVFLAQLETGTPTVRSIENATGLRVVGRAIAVDCAGSVQVVGDFPDTITFEQNGQPDVTFTSTGGADGYVTRLTQTPSAQWATESKASQITGVGGTLNQFVSDVATDGTRNAFIVGSFTSQTVELGSITINADVAGQNSFIAFYNPLAGKYRWATSIQRQDISSTNVVSADTVSQNCLHVTGGFTGENDFQGGDPFVLTSVGNQDLFVSAYDKCSGKTIYAFQVGVVSNSINGRSIHHNSKRQVNVLGFVDNAGTIPIGNKQVSLSGRGFILFQLSH